MTKYRLKDQDLQKKLDEITDGDFSECLEKGAVDQFCRVGSIGVTCGRFGCNGHPRLKIDFYLHEYEELKEYNPNDWNNFPDTTPPENIPMRVEFIWNDGALGKCCGVYRNGVWSNSEDRDCEIENVKRFRPWE